MKKILHARKSLYFFRDTHLKFMRFYTRILNHSGLTLPKYVLLSQISISGMISMTEASEKLLISKPALTHIASRLIKEKLIKRSPNSLDHRSYLLEVLPRGKTTVTKAQEMLRKFILYSLKDLKSYETIIIDKFYRSLSAHMDQFLTLPKQKLHGNKS